MTAEQIESRYMAGIDTAACQWHLLLMFNPNYAERIEELRTEFYELRKTRPEINFQEFVKEKNAHTPTHHNPPALDAGAQSARKAERPK